MSAINIRLEMDLSPQSMQAILDRITQLETKIMATIADVQAAADALTLSISSLTIVVETQAIPLLNQLAAAGNAEAQAVVDALTASKASVDQAQTDLSMTVSADTPPAPPTP